MEALLSGDGGRLILDIDDYENSRAVAIDDRNWLRASLQVTAGPFHGSISLALTTVELERVCRQVREIAKSLKGSMSFATVEGDWEISLALEGSSTVVVKGEVRSPDGDGSTIRYQFRTDPITLETWAEKLGAIVRRFPAVQGQPS